MGLSENTITQETRKKINGVEYIIESVFSKTAKETAESKLLKLLGNRVAEEIKSAENAVFIGKST